MLKGLKPWEGERWEDLKDVMRGNTGQGSAQQTLDVSLSSESSLALWANLLQLQSEQRNNL